MTSFIELQKLTDIFTDRRALWILLWAGTVVITLTLFALMRTRWGQARPLAKCAVLSLLVHLLLVGYAYKTHLFGVYPSRPSQSSVQITFTAGDNVPQTARNLTPMKPWEKLESPQPVPPDKPTLPREQASEERHQRQVPNLSIVSHKVPLETAPRADRSQPGPEIPIGSTPETRESGVDPAQIDRSDGRQHKAVHPSTVVTELARADTPDHSEVPSRVASLPRMSDSQITRNSTIQKLAELPLVTDRAKALAARLDRVQASSDGPQIPLELRKAMPDRMPVEPARLGADDPSAVNLPIRANRSDPTRRVADGQPLPEIYRLRSSPERTSVARRQGGSILTEQAVGSALRWLASQQSADGRWDTSNQGGGLETSVDGQDRSGAGTEADTGITGLVLLAYLGAGHSHLDGPYQESVQLGLEYLMRSQRPDGNLAGNAGTFARMYCHGMASFALSESLAITGDQRTKPYVQRAVNYSIAAQHPTGGGWRYQPHDQGDMSQFGWQVMALKSAELAGIEIPQRTQSGMHRFLRSVISGSSGGMASYRPGRQFNHTMTAEALVCRVFLGMDSQNPAADEAAHLLVQHLPGDGQPNYYYWYYATLGLHQVHDGRWQRWNRALKRQLLDRQIKQGPVAGSWDPDSVWGGYGGRSYSTALAAMCLEVYYRYLPLYQNSTGSP